VSRPTRGNDEFDLFRRAPTQERSRALVERILEATLTELNRSGARSLTTNRIAERAGIDIASLYRYFGSKEAILVEITERWYAKIQAVYARHPATALGERSLVEHLRRVFDEIEEIPEMSRGYQELALLVGMLPPLRALEREHEMSTARYWAGVFRHYGATWPEARLVAFARMFYHQVDDALMLAGRLRPEDARWVLAWQRRVTLGMLRMCIPGARGFGARRALSGRARTPRRRS